MSRSVVNALKAVAALVSIAVVCVGLLAVCNMFFPKYVPTLDAATASFINSIAPTDVDDETAYTYGYIVMLYEEDCGVSLDSYNKQNKQRRANILAVYGEVKGVRTGAFAVESSSTGRDGEIIILTAYKDGVVIGATVKKQGESYFYKLPEDIFGSAIGASGDVSLTDELGKTGATLSLGAIERALNLSNAFAAEYGENIRSSISKKSHAALQNSGREVDRD